MIPALAFASTLPNLAAWLLAHADELGGAFARLRRPVTAALTDPGASVDRVGSALVAHHNGQAQVLGLLHQHSTKLDDIAAAVDGVGDAAAEIDAKLGVLTTLSMISLGVTVLSQVHLAYQFARLAARLDRLLAELRDLKAMLQSDAQSELDAGLIQLKNALDTRPADPEMAAGLFNLAMNNLTRSAAKYAAHLQNGVGLDSPPFRWVLARSLTVAALGEASVYLHLRKPELAAQALANGLKSLRQHAKSVFARTVGAGPGNYLIPALAAHGITLEVVAELYRQARLAEVAEVPEAPSTAAELFESLRGRLPDDPYFGREGKVRRLRVEFAEAATAVEEVNRLRGLALAVEHYGRAGQDYLALAEQIRGEIEARRPDEGTCFAVFPETAA
jgi:hypothetical protein